MEIGNPKEKKKKKNLSNIIQEINLRLMTLRMFTEGDERKIKGNLRHLLVISSEWQKSFESSILSLFGTWKKLSFTEKARKKSPIKPEDQIKYFLLVLLIQWSIIIESYLEKNTKQYLNKTELQIRELQRKAIITLLDIS